MAKELSVEKPNDVVKHLEKLVAQTWVYKDKIGKDARSLQKIDYSHVRIRHVFQLNNPELIQRYFVRHLKTFSNYSLPLHLKHTPIKTKQVDRQRAMSDVSLQLETISRNVSRTNLKAMHKSESLTEVQIHACLSDPKLLRKSASLTGSLGDYKNKLTTDTDGAINNVADPSSKERKPTQRRNSLALGLIGRLPQRPFTMRQSKPRSNSVVPGASGYGTLRSLFRRSSSKTRVPSAPAATDEIHIDMDAIQDCDAQNTSPVCYNLINKNWFLFCRLI